MLAFILVSKVLGNSTLIILFKADFLTKISELGIHFIIRSPSACLIIINNAFLLNLKTSQACITITSINVIVIWYSK